MAKRFVGRHPGIAALSAAAPAVAAAIAVGATLGDEAGHAAGHLAVAVPALALLLSTRWWRPAADGRLGRSARTVTVVGLAVLGGGQVMEAVGAFGFEGYARQYALLAGLHDAALVFGPVGILVVLAGALLTGVARLRDSRLPRWTVAAFALLALFGATTLMRVVIGGG